MESLEAERDRARDLAVADLADAIESIGFECTRCGACCKGYTPGGDGSIETDADDVDVDQPHTEAHTEPDTEAHTEPHTATVFPEEVRELRSALADGDNPDDTTDMDHEYDWRDIARPMPYGLSDTANGDPVGETFEWALQTDACGNCTFYEETDGEGACTVHEDRPLVCQTYPFSVALGGTSQPMGEAVDAAGLVRAHECEGLGREISRSDAEALASALKQRAVRELSEAIAVRDAYRPATTSDGVVVHDSEGQKRPDGTPIDGDCTQRK